MEKTLFQYVWRHSARQQIALLALTVASFPILYVTLELPKRIINDAISAEAPPIWLWGVPFSQVDYLLLLSGAFLGFVILGGLLKMRINTFKGVVAERLLRRLRYELISRILRFPLPHFRRTSQGELIAMVTAEAEPLGGITGDMLAQPVFQSGQMLTILGFLFVQNGWLGLAATALIPLQAYVIPILQRQINLLNKERVIRVRKLSERIGETAAGVEALRANNGVAYALANFTHLLGELFEIRYRIYRKKFFMKFLNNFINQLTPFFFFSIGGWLAIEGRLSVGALVAALAAYKDLSAPWKELLDYYNQLQDMSLRYRTIVDEFEPEGLIEARLIEGRPEHTPRLSGPIRMSNVSVADPGGGMILSGVTLEIPPASMVAVRSDNVFARRAFAQALARAVPLASGRIELAGHDLAELHQEVVAARIGVADGAPHLFNATIAENLLMPLRRAPPPNGAAPRSRRLEEALAAGNSADPLDEDWLDPRHAGLASEAELLDWQFEIMKAMGVADFLFHRCLGARMDPALHPDIAERIVALRPAATKRVRLAGLTGAVDFFDPDRFNPGLAVAENLLFAAPRQPLDAAVLARDDWFLHWLRAMGLEDDLFALAEDLLRALVGAFGEVGAEHPLFRRLSGVDAAVFARLQETHRRGLGCWQMEPEDRTLLLTLPFTVTPSQLGDAFPQRLRREILRLRRQRRDELRAARLGDLFTPLEPETYAPGLSLLENLLFGRVSANAGAAAEKLVDIGAQMLDEVGLRGPVTLLVGDAQAGLAGANLPPVAHERIAFVRAAIKKPDLLILDRALASHTPEQRLEMRRRLRALLPEATIVFLEPQFNRPQDFDLFLEIEGGRLAAPGAAPAEPVHGEARSVSADLAAKLEVLSRVSLFYGLERRQLRLLAYASRWIQARAGEHLFRRGDPPDGAYVLTEGLAELRWPSAGAEADPVSEVEPGRLVGDLSVIRGQPRDLDMLAMTDVVGLRVGARELLDVIEHDPEVAMALLRTVSGYLIQSVGRRRSAEPRREEREAV